MSDLLQPTGGAVLYVQSRVQDRARAAFDDWCNAIHHFDTMRIDGFLCLRRFERIESIGVPSPFDLLTLYQLRDVAVADFDSAAYRAHTASYTKPPAVVDGAVSFQRAIYRRTDVTGERQAIGHALASIAASSEEAIDAATAVVAVAAGTITSTRLALADGPGHDRLLVVEVVDEPAATGLVDLLHHELDGAAIEIAAFRQVFPERGVLLRDRTFAV